MNSFQIFLKLVLVLLILNCYYQASGDTYVKDTITKTRGVLAASKEIFSSASSIIKAANPGKIFAKISGILGSLGPAAMAISAVLSIVTAFLPKEDSPELKALKAGFEETNRNLDILASKIGNLDNIIELSSARAAYVKTVSTINNNFEALQEAQKTNSIGAYQIFAEQFDRTFEFSTAQMYDAMTGSTGAFGFNLVNLYKTYVKCNPVKVSQFCTMGMHLITKGLAVEGAYNGFRNHSIKDKEESWKEKMNDVGKQCSAVIESCQNNWKAYAYQEYTDFHRQMSSNNQEIADKLAKALDNVVPQRSWLVVAYNEAWGFGPHTFYSDYEFEKKWRERGKCVTIFSTERREPLGKNEFNDLVRVVEGQKAISAAVNDCKIKYGLIEKDRYQDHAKIIASRVDEKVPHGVLYAIQLNYQPAIVSTGGTIYISVQKWRCSSPNFKLVVFL